MAVMTTTIYLHRYAAHRALKLHQITEWIAQSILWLTTGISRKEWVAIHLCHHAHTDEIEDPHSPKILGFWTVQLGNAWLYRKATKNIPLLEKYGGAVKETWWEKKVTRHSTLGLLLGIAILCMACGFVGGLIAAATHTILYVFILNNLVNGYCHTYGYKNFETSPAFNNWGQALVTGGESLHNNHHHNPSNPKLSYKKWEIDPGWICINILCFLGAVRLKK
jgi:stearoyl-CoA desaturase (delta-9 desaturase)